MKKVKLMALSLILLFFAPSTVAIAADTWPGWLKKDGKNGGTGNGTVSVAEPAAMLCSSELAWFPSASTPRRNAPRSSKRLNPIFS